MDGCKYAQNGHSCSLNGNCKYPECMKEKKSEDFRKEVDHFQAQVYLRQYRKLADEAGEAIFLPEAMERYHQYMLKKEKTMSFGNKMFSEEELVEHLKRMRKPYRSAMDDLITYGECQMPIEEIKCCEPVEGFYLGMVCSKCGKPFRQEL